MPSIRYPVTEEGQGWSFTHRSDTPIYAVKRLVWNNPNPAPRSVSSQREEPLPPDRKTPTYLQVVPNSSKKPD